MKKRPVEALIEDGQRLCSEAQTLRHKTSELLAEQKRKQLEFQAIVAKARADLQEWSFDH